MTSGSNPIIRISFRISSVVGCIDDKHISTIAPSENETNYCMEWKDARSVVRAVTTTTAVKYTNYSLFFGHLYFLIQKQKLFFLLLDLRNLPILDHLLFICQWCCCRFSLCLLAVDKSVVNFITLIKKCIIIIM